MLIIHLINDDVCDDDSGSRRHSPGDRGGEATSGGLLHWQSAAGVTLTTVSARHAGRGTAVVVR